MESYPQAAVELRGGLAREGERARASGNGPVVDNEMAFRGETLQKVSLVRWQAWESGGERTLYRLATVSSGAGLKDALM